MYELKWNSHKNKINTRNKDRQGGKKGTHAFAFRVYTATTVETVKLPVQESTWYKILNSLT